MSDDDAPTLLGYFADGFSPPLVGLCVLSGLAVGFLSAPSAPAEAAPTRETQPETPDEPDVDAPDVDEPEGDGEPLSASEIERLIAAGDFEEAQEEAELAGERGLEEHAFLFATLTARIQPGPLASVKQLEEVTVAGEQRIGRIKQEDAELLQLEGYDGTTIDLPAQGLAERRTLHGMEARRVLAERLRADRTKLGEVGGLTIHRYAFWAFRAGLRRLGTELLEEALRTDEGRVLVDMFGSGDFERLQRARLVVCGTLPASGTGLPADPKPVRPDPKPVRPDPKPVRPDPTPVQPGEVVIVDPLADDPDWQRAEAAYQSGVREYRAAFGQVGSPRLKAAIKRFRAAQDLLDALLNKYDGEPEQRIERRLVELNTLIYDCAKQGGA